MKILLLGRNGQVGWELQRSLAPLAAASRASTASASALMRCASSGSLSALSTAV